MSHQSIPWIKLCKGAELCLRNAMQMLDDAELLRKHRRFTSCCFIALLAREEAGKAMLLLDFKAKKRSITKKQWKDKLLKHVVKLEASLPRSSSRSRVNSTIAPSVLSKIMAKLASGLREDVAYVDFDFDKQEWVFHAFTSYYRFEMDCWRAIELAEISIRCVQQQLKKEHD